MNFKILIAAMILIAVIGGVAVLLTQKPAYPDIENPQPAKGNLEAKVIVQEFSDYQCTACIATEPYVEAIFQEFKDQVRLEYKQFPLTKIHNFALTASEASFCAQDNGKFWEYHNLLFKANGKLDNDSLVSIAKSLGIDEAKFKNCIYSGKKEARVNQDIAEGTGLGVNGTPTFFVNGEKVEGTALSEILANLKAKIQQKINEVK